MPTLPSLDLHGTVGITTNDLHQAPILVVETESYPLSSYASRCLRWSKRAHWWSAGLQIMRARVRIPVTAGFFVSIDYCFFILPMLLDQARRKCGAFDVRLSQRHGRLEPAYDFLTSVFTLKNKTGLIMKWCIDTDPVMVTMIWVVTAPC